MYFDPDKPQEVFAKAEFQMPLLNALELAAVIDMFETAAFERDDHAVQCRDFFPDTERLTRKQAAYCRKRVQELRKIQFKPKS